MMGWSGFSTLKEDLGSSMRISMQMHARSSCKISASLKVPWLWNGRRWSDFHTRQQMQVLFR